MEFNLFIEKDHKDIKCLIHGYYLSTLITFKQDEHWTGCPSCIREKKHQDFINEQKQIAQEVKDRELNKILGRAAIPDYYKDSDFNNYKINNIEQQKVVNNCKYFAENFEKAIQKGVQGIFIGKTGTGKGHLACSIVKKVISHGYSAIFSTMSDIMLAIRDSYTNNKSELEILHKFYEIDLLVIDECAIKAKEAEQNMLFNLVNKRVFDCKPTIMITNELQELELKLGTRIVSRMKESNFIQDFNWIDYRIEGK